MRFRYTLYALFFLVQNKTQVVCSASLFYYWICRIFFFVLLLLRSSNSVHCLLFALLLYFINFVVIWRCWCHGMLSNIQRRLGVPSNTSMVVLDGCTFFLRTFQKLNNFFYLFSWCVCKPRFINGTACAFFLSRQDMCSMYAVFIRKSYSLSLLVARLFYWHSSISIRTCP